MLFATRALPQDFYQNLLRFAEEKNIEWDYKDFMKDYQPSKWLKKIKEEIDSMHTEYDKNRMFEYAQAMAYAVYRYAYAKNIFDVRDITKHLIKTESFYVALSKATDQFRPKFEKDGSKKFIYKGWRHIDFGELLMLSPKSAQNTLGDIAYRCHDCPEYLREILPEYLQNPWYHNDSADLLALDVLVSQLCIGGIGLATMTKQANTGFFKNIFRSKASVQHQEKNIIDLYNLAGHTVATYNQLVDRPIDIGRLTASLNALSDRGVQITNACFAILTNAQDRNMGKNLWYPDTQIAFKI
jgi:hypothetical protein